MQSASCDVWIFYGSMNHIDVLMSHCVEQENTLKNQPHYFKLELSNLCCNKHSYGIFIVLYVVIYVSV